MSAMTAARSVAVWTAAAVVALAGGGVPALGQSDGRTPESPRQGSPEGLPWPTRQPGAEPAGKGGGGGGETRPAARRVRMPVPVTRADMAAAYLRFERALADNPPEGAKAAEINRAFDGLTQAFFTGDFSSAVRRLNQLIMQLEGGPADPQAATWRVLADSLKVSSRPQVIVSGRDGQVRVRLTSMYLVSGAPGGRVMKVSVGGLSGTVELPQAVGSGGEGQVPVDVTVEMALPADWSESEPGLIDVQVGDAAGESMFGVGGQGTVAVDERAAADWRAAITAKLDQAGADPVLELARGLLRSRLELLTDDPADGPSAALLARRDPLGESLLREAEAMAQGTNPYVNRVGDWWAGLPINGAVMPTRIFAPGPAAEEGALPLVIALHGAGGDENMFMDGYGAGAIKVLAEEEEFLVVSPRSEMLMGNAANFTRLLEVVGAHYRIDRSRVYVIGHSMGAMATWGLVSGDAGAGIAAAACIAGGPRMAPRGGPAEGQRAVPLLVVGAELDPLIPGASLQRAATAMKTAGWPVEFVMSEGWGHTLVVGHELADAVAWLLKHRLPGAAGEGGGKVDAEKDAGAGEESK